MTTISRLAIPEQNPVFGGNTGFNNSKYSPAVEAGGLLFISGQTGMELDGTWSADAERQIDLAFKRLGEILRLKDLDFTDLVEIETYHTDIPAHWQTFVAVKNRYIVQDFPAWTAVGTQLVRPGMIVEIRAVAALKK